MKVFFVLFVLIFSAYACRRSNKRTQTVRSQNGMAPKAKVWQSLASTEERTHVIGMWEAKEFQHESKKSFKSMVQQAEQDQTPLDIVFVMDNSGSVGLKYFELQKQFASDFAKYLPDILGEIRVAIVSYATTVKLEFNLNRYKRRKCALKGIEQIQYTGGYTATGTALNYVQTSLIFNGAAGARTNAKKMIYLLTDGRSNRGVKPSIAADTLKRKGATITVLGVTENIRKEELQSIASGPFYLFDNFNVIKKVSELTGNDQDNIFTKYGKSQFKSFLNQPCK